MIGRPLNYYAYVLRFWQERGGSSETPVWRFSLEDPHTGQKQGFASLRDLVAMLLEKMEGSTTQDRSN